MCSIHMLVCRRFFPFSSSEGSLLTRSSTLSKRKEREREEKYRKHLKHRGAFVLITAPSEDSETNTNKEISRAPTPDSRKNSSTVMPVVNDCLENVQHPIAEDIGKAAASHQSQQSHRYSKGIGSVSPGVLSTAVKNPNVGCEKVMPLSYADEHFPELRIGHKKQQSPAGDNVAVACSPTKSTEVLVKQHRHDKVKDVNEYNLPPLPPLPLKKENHTENQHFYSLADGEDDTDDRHYATLQVNLSRMDRYRKAALLKSRGFDDDNTTIDYTTATQEYANKYMEPTTTSTSTDSISANYKDGKHNRRKAAALEVRSFSFGKVLGKKHEQKAPPKTPPRTDKMKHSDQ